MKSLALWLPLLAASCLDAQVVLSRRIYAEHGRTWRQLWIAGNGGTDFRQLTHSRRDHTDPLISRDGRTVYFISDRDGLRSLNAYGGGEGRELWSFDRKTLVERKLWETADNDRVTLSGTTADGGVLIRVGSELRCLLHHPWRITRIDPSDNGVAVSPDGRTLAVVIAKSLDREGQSHGSRLFLVDTATGRSRTELGEYEALGWSPDGTELAAIAGDGLAIVNVAARKEVLRTAWPKRDVPPQDLVWSPDGKSILAGLYGEEGGSGDPQSDYFLLNLAAGKWTPSLTARQVIWLPSGALLYLRPYSTTPLTPGSPHTVWTAGLAVFDLATRKDQELTAGLTLNDSLTYRRQ